MNWVLRLIVAGVAIISTAGVADAQRRGGDPKLAARKNPVPATAQSVTAGRNLYNKNCRHCHGLKGLGDGPLAPKNPKPASLIDDKWDHGASDGEIYAVIWNGAPAKDSEMKPMKGTLRENDVWHIVNFIRSIGPKAGAGAKPAAGAKPSTAKPATR
jgi:mono/diheme cytochrome c family protein